MLALRGRGDHGAARDRGQRRGNRLVMRRSEVYEPWAAPLQVTLSSSSFLSVTGAAESSCPTSAVNPASASPPRPVTDLTMRLARRRNLVADRMRAQRPAVVAAASHRGASRQTVGWKRSVEA